MNAPSVAVRRPALRRWGVTLTATDVSTYALDAFATAAGVALAASQLLNGVSHGLLLAVLAASYVVWGAGLRVNLVANARLLERTGTSTNACRRRSTTSRAAAARARGASRPAPATSRPSCSRRLRSRRARSAPPW